MKLHLGHLLGLSAIIVAACAAFFSVYGLSQLFAGASLAVIIMASALELSKLVAASFLHTYWGRMSKLLRVYLTVGVIVLVTITSAGIYGFLSNAYQKTAFNLEVHEGELAVLDGKITQFQSKISTNEDNMDSKTHRVTQLTDLRAKQEVRLDSMINRRYFANANATRDEIEKANLEIKNLNSEIDDLSKANNTYNDSISKYEIQKLEMKSSSDVAAEIGPLKYMAELINKPMDEVVNYFILLLIMVFDPLAISLVIATNWIFENKKREAEDKSEDNDDDPEPTDPTPGDDDEKVGIIAQEYEDDHKDDDAYGMNKEDELIEKLSKGMAEEIDREITKGDNINDESEILPVMMSSRPLIETNPEILFPGLTKEPVKLIDAEEEEPIDTTEDEIVDDIEVVEEEVVRPPRKPLTVDDINEIKKMRSTKVEPKEEEVEEKEEERPTPPTPTRPEPKQSSSNNISRIGSNKYLKDGKDMIYRRNGNR